MTDFAIIPSIDELRKRPVIHALEARFGAAATVDALRSAVADLRRAMARGDASIAPSRDERLSQRIEEQAGVRLEEMFGGALQPVINATGVVIHTNLGRAPLAEPAIARIADVARGYASLEYDLARGARGRRDVHAEALICRLTGAEAAVVVNNNAAATMLLLAALAAGREVIVSRGELVEIGGGFRIPEIMMQSGAVLREVGTTNKTRASDYAAAINERTALILRVHPSNFRIEGFTERPRVEEIVAIGRRLNVPVAEDLGSGQLWLPNHTGSDKGSDPGTDRGTDQGTDQGTDRGTDQGSDRGTDQGSDWGSDPVSDPGVRETVAAGVDICCFSGDKLLGGPQAGIVAGRTALVDRVRTHPLMRALRVDKLTYAALEATLVEHAAGRAATTIPVPRMLATTPDAIRLRANALADAVRDTHGSRVEVIPGTSAVGGGSAPGVGLRTWLVAVDFPGLTANALEERLRKRRPPVIARIEHDRVVFDLRTVFPAQDAELARIIRACRDSASS